MIVSPCPFFKFQISNVRALRGNHNSFNARMNYIHRANVFLSAYERAIFKHDYNLQINTVQYCKMFHYKLWIIEDNSDAYRYPQKFKQNLNSESIIMYINCDNSYGTNHILRSTSVVSLDKWSCLMKITKIFNQLLYLYTEASYIMVITR